MHRSPTCIAEDVRDRLLIKHATSHDGKLKKLPFNYTVYLPSGRMHPHRLLHCSTVTATGTSLSQEYAICLRKIASGKRTVNHRSKTLELPTVKVPLGTFDCQPVCHWRMGSTTPLSGGTL
eukprot:scaffold105841_cov17-Tisochrysis_lutea.AAC.1